MSSRLAAMIAALTLALGCGSTEDGDLHDGTRRRPGPPGTHVERPTAAGTATPAQTPAGPSAPAGEVLRAKEVTADVVRARVVYAKEVTASEAQVAHVVESPEDKRWEEGRSDAQVQMPEIVVDTIYAKEIRCRLLVADELHVQEAKLGE